MGRLRVTVGGLMGVVVAAGIGLAALANASPAWAGAVLLLTLGLLAAAVLGAACGCGRSRAWWLGFALFGWGYEALTAAPWSSPEALPTHALVEGLYSRFSPRKLVAMERDAAATLADAGQVLHPHPKDMTGIVPLASPGEVVVVISTLDAEAFRPIGHHGFALVAAVLGGLIAGRFHASRQPPDLIPRAG